MSRSVIIAGAILAGFVLYILAKGDAAKYVALLTPSAKQPSNIVNQGIGGGSPIPGTLPSGYNPLTGSRYYQPGGGFDSFSQSGSGFLGNLLPDDTNSSYYGPGGSYQDTGGAMI